MVEGTGLENRQRLTVARGFESHPLRQFSRSCRALKTPTHPNDASDHVEAVLCDHGSRVCGIVTDDI